MIHDAVTLERQGIPTLAVSHDRFEAAARAQARALGLGALEILIVPQPKPGEDRASQQRSAEAVFDQAVRALARPAPQPA